MPLTTTLNRIKYRQTTMKKLYRILFAIGTFFAILAMGFMFFIYNKYSQNLPDYTTLKDYKPIVATRIYASDGSLLSEFSKEKRIFVPIDSIPKSLIHAFISAEDQNYYNHFGIDLFAIFRTSIHNAISKMNGGGLKGGASTITQQVVKNFLLTNEKTLERKIKEAILAIKINQHFNKEEILELYLNQIYLGSGSYGVAAAAQVYFDKAIDDLTIEESALLATLPKAPSKLDPRKDIIKAKIRRDWVIDRMYEEKYITQEEKDVAQNTEIKLSKNFEDEQIKEGFFSDSVKKELTQLYGSDNVFESGIVVHTTLNTKFQEIAEKAFQEGVESYDKRHGYRGEIAKIAVDENWQQTLSDYIIEKLYPKDWRKALVLSTTKDEAEIVLTDGSKGFISLESLKWAKTYIDVNTQSDEPTRVSQVLKKGDMILVEELGVPQLTEIVKGSNPNEEVVTKTFYNLQQIPEANGGLLAMDPHTGRILAMMGGYIDAPNQFNRTTQAMRQPGSTMKTFGYIAALENGFTPADLIIDEEISLNQGDGLPPYHPSNYSGKFYGPTTLRIGLEKSRNVTTVRLADQVGLEKVVDLVKRFGVNDNPKQIYSLILGSTETNIMRMAKSYSMMVNGGKEIFPSMIEKIQDRDGKILHRRDNRNCIECSVQNAQDLTQDDIKNITMPTLLDDRNSIIDSATAYQITSMLQGTVERGTGRRAKSIGKIVGGKTGTTNDFYDSWFLGFSPDLVVATYVGFDTPKTLGKGETGASIALPIFINFMKNALEDTPSMPFRVPDTIKFVKIDRLTGSRPRLDTDRENIFFEALKINDNIEENNGNFPVKDEDDDTFENDNDNLGIY